jgi:hypothetical protein
MGDPHMRTLDRQTKPELITLIGTLQADLHATQSTLAQSSADVIRLKSRIQELEEALVTAENRRKFEGASYRRRVRTLSDRTGRAQSRPDYAALSREYCAEYGVRSVSQADLEAYAESRS